MNFQEFSIFFFQFLILLALSYYFEIRYSFSKIGILSFLLLFLSSISLAAVSAKIYELDTQKYMRDAILILSYIKSDSKYYSLFFLTGGNSIYPNSFYNLLISTNTWSNYSSYTIEKFFLFFALVSKPNIYNVSLFFGFMSFLSKLNLLKIGNIYNSSSVKRNILLVYLLFGGIDIYFISGAYKECLVLFMASYITLYLHIKKTIFRTIIAVVILVHFVFLKLEVSVLIIILGSFCYFINKLRMSSVKEKLFSAIFFSCISIGIYISPIKAHILDKMDRYNTLAKGNTNIDIINWNSDLISIGSQTFYRWLGLFYSNQYSRSSKFVIFDIMIVSSILFLIYLIYHQSKIWKTISICITVFFLVYSLLTAITVHNYAAQLRYRSPVFVLFIFALILNLNMRKKHI